MAIKVTLRGKRQFINVIESLGEVAHQKLMAVAIDIGTKIEKDAIERSPKDFGFLRSAYRFKYDYNKVIIDNTMEYAYEVHESEGRGKGIPRVKVSRNDPRWRGTYWDHGQPQFLKLAVEAYASEYQQKIAEAITEVQYELQRRR